jgi:hypothetical protein
METIINTSIGKSRTRNMACDTTSHPRTNKVHQSGNYNPTWSWLTVVAGLAFLAGCFYLIAFVLYPIMYK